jgi:protein-tyrosine phosphatase
MYIVRPWLAIGNYREPKNLELLQANGIGALLLLESAVEHPGMRSLFLEVEDGYALPLELLRRGLDFIQVEREASKTVLIACAAGISRSTTFAIAAIKEAEQIDLLTAYRGIRTQHPRALPHQRLWTSLCEYYGERVPYGHVVIEYTRDLNIKL